MAYPVGNAAQTVKEGMKTFHTIKVIAQRI